MLLFLFIKNKGILFRNIPNTGRWHYSALGSRLGSYVLIRLPSWQRMQYTLLYITHKTQKISVNSQGKETL